MNRDYNEILPGLYQGSFHQNDPALWSEFDVLVHMPVELPLTIPTHRGKLAIACPIDDTGARPLNDREIANLARTANITDQVWSSGRKVLVSCAQGRNRSGLLVAILVLRHNPKWTVGDAVGYIRRKRPSVPVLTNHMFVKHLREWRGE